MTETPLPSDSNPTSNNNASQKSGWFLHVRLVSLLTLVSRVLGLVRDIGMAALFGNGAVLDAFTLAFRLPNMSRRLFGEGALTTAFLPLYVKELKQDPGKANRLASAVLALLLVLLSLIVFAGESGIYALLRGNVLGDSGALMLSMTAWLLPYVILICLSAQLTAILHSHHQFAVPAMIPIVLNSIWIFALWVVIPSMEKQAENQSTQISIVVTAILVGGIGQLLLPGWVLFRNGFRFQWKCADQFQRALFVFHSMIPIVIGLSVTQLNAFCDGALAWWYSRPEQGEWIATGTASALYYGQRMFQFPLGVFGIALGTVLFARIAHHVEAGRQKQIQQDVTEGLRLILTVGCPATIGLVLLASPLTDCLLRHGRFDAIDAAQTSATIAAYGTAIWAFLGISLLQKVYYAMGDAKTPLRIGLGCVGINLGLNFLFMYLLGGVGLAYATSFSAVFQVVALFILLRSRIGFQMKSVFGKFLFKILFATVCMGGICWAARQCFEEELGGWQRMWRLAVPLLCSVVSYFIILKILHIGELDYIVGLRKSLDISSKREEIDKESN